MDGRTLTKAGFIILIKASKFLANRTDNPLDNKIVEKLEELYAIFLG